MATKAKDAGFEAYDRGEDIKTNPYKTSDEWDEWEAGWLEAKADDIANIEDYDAFHC